MKLEGAGGRGKRFTVIQTFFCSLHPLQGHLHHCLDNYPCAEACFVN